MREFQEKDKQFKYGLIVEYGKLQQITSLAFIKHDELLNEVRTLKDELNENITNVQ